MLFVDKVLHIINHKLIALDTKKNIIVQSVHNYYCLRYPETHSELPLNTNSYCFRHNWLHIKQGCILYINTNNQQFHKKKVFKEVHI